MLAADCALLPAAASCRHLQFCTPCSLLCLVGTLTISACFCIAHNKEFYQTQLSSYMYTVLIKIVCQNKTGVDQEDDIVFLVLSLVYSSSPPWFTTKNSGSFLWLPQCHRNPKFLGYSATICKRCMFYAKSKMAALWQLKRRACVQPLGQCLAFGPILTHSYRFLFRRGTYPGKFYGGRSPCANSSEVSMI